LPIEPDYVGHAIDSISSEKVIVKWKETEGKDEVVLISENNLTNQKKQKKYAKFECSPFIRNQRINST